MGSDGKNKREKENSKDNTGGGLCSNDYVFAWHLDGDCDFNY